MSEPTADQLRERRRRFIDSFDGLRDEIKAAVSEWPPPTIEQTTIIKAARRYVAEQASRKSNAVNE